MEFTGERGILDRTQLLRIINNAVTANALMHFWLNLYNKFNVQGNLTAVQQCVAEII